MMSQHMQYSVIVADVTGDMKYGSCVGEELGNLIRMVK